MTKILFPKTQHFADFSVKLIYFNLIYSAMISIKLNFSMPALTRFV